MEWKQSYNDLCKEIEVLELRLYDLENELRATRRVIDTGTPPSSNYVRVPLDKALRQFDDVCERIRFVDNILQSKLLIKREMEKHLNQFEGLEYRVAYMRDIEGKHLDQIADELGYSYNWILKVSSRVKRNKAERRQKKLAIS